MPSVSYFQSDFESFLFIPLSFGILLAPRSRTPQAGTFHMPNPQRGRECQGVWRSPEYEWPRTGVGQAGNNITFWLSEGAASSSGGWAGVSLMAPHGSPGVKLDDHSPLFRQIRTSQHHASEHFTNSQPTKICSSRILHPGVVVRGSVSVLEGNWGGVRVEK